jgi:acetolactate synthase-1/2/3 large subunit
MHFVAALDRVPGMRGILCLFEGVCSGAADGYARVKGKPAATLLHLGPGLANGLANFHNARKARSPIVSIVGEHATAHLKVDAPLSSNVQAFAGAVSDAVRTATSADEIAAAAAATIADACGPPGQTAMLIIPADYSWSETNSAIPVNQPAPPPKASAETLERVRGLLSKPGAALLLSGGAANARALDAAARTGARVMLARNAPVIDEGRGAFPAAQVPYFPEGALPFLADVTHLILVESEAPVSFFAYPNIPSLMTPEHCEIITLAARGEDGTAALEALAGAGLRPVPEPESPALPAPDSQSLTLASLGAALTRFLPDDSIVVDEMVSSASQVLPFLAHAARHDRLPLTGGSIGLGLPMALGAAIAAPHRKVVVLEADGSAMYTLQSLWTMARENLDVTAVILNNRRYRILDIEMQRTGANGFGEIANNMIDIGTPDLDWVKLSEGCGVQATRATTAVEFSDQFHAAVSERGPRLIEARIP